MKRHCLFFSFMALLASVPAWGQTKLLIARTSLYLDGATGTVTDGDSTTLSYNNQHQTTQFKSWKIDNSGAWKLSYRITDRSFDAEGRLLSETGQTGNDVDGWTNSGRNSYTYDSYGNRVSWLSEDWDGAMWVTDFVSTTIWTYNANGQVLTKTGTSYQSIYTYNAQGLLETETNQNLLGGNWVDFDRNVYVYSPDGAQIMSKTTYVWAANMWAKSSRKLYSYDAGGDLTEERTEFWNGNSWDNAVWEVNTYDANHNIVHWMRQDWTAGAWAPSFQQYDTYDAESHWLTSRFEFWDGGVWSVVSLGRNYYETFVSTQMPKALDFRVYPNPASTTVRLEGTAMDRVQVFDLQGREVMYQGLGGRVQEWLEVGQLPAGTYFLQVTGVDGGTGGKLVQVRR